MLDIGCDIKKKDVGMEEDEWQLKNKLNKINKLALFPPQKNK